MSSSQSLDRSFFTTDPITAARELLGWRLCYKGCEGVIVETEAYMGLSDPACHTFRRPSTRAFVEKYPAGTAYVYLNYGVNWLLNVLVKGSTPESQGFVLVRAVEPLCGIELMEERRFSSRQNSSKTIDQLCSGPGKLTQAFGIDGSHHGIDLFKDPVWNFKKDPSGPGKFSREIIATPRIGISQARERLWRFVFSDLI